MSATDADILVVGAGAAGLMAAIAAARERPDLCVVAVDGAERLGAKIRISGGGRCNVTHDVVTPADFAGGTPNAIRKVLRSFGVEAVRAFFTDLGVDLVREDQTGKLFPATNKATTVLDALIQGARDAGVELVHPWRVESITREADPFVVEGPQGALDARRVILATGGRSVPQTGSDGHGFALATSLGHTLTEHIVPALAPLCLPDDHPLPPLRGIAESVRLVVKRGSGKQVASARGALLITHFGISGPAVLDISRHWILARDADPHASLRVAWLPDLRREDLDAALAALGPVTVETHLKDRLPTRLVGVLSAHAGVSPTTPGHALRKDARRALVEAVLDYPLPVTAARGWAYAEATAGGVPLPEVVLATMASRPCPGLHLCGEVLDVDGKIGGYNFHWAWASGHLAGRGAARREMA